MNKNQLLDMMNSIRDKYVLEAIESRNNTASKPKSHLRLHRIGLLAAVLAALLLLAGCVAVYLRLQDMSIGKDTYVQTHDEQGRAIEPTERVRDVINFSGIAGSPEQKASAQWYEFTENYDPEMKYLTNVGDDPDIPNNYEYIYGCYTQEMVDKLDEIKNENQVRLLEAVIPIQRWHDDIALEALGKTSLLREGADATMKRVATIGQVSGILLAPYNFKLEYDLTLTGENPVWRKPVCVTELYQHNGYLPYNGGWHIALDAFQQWNYTTSQGVSLLMAVDSTGNGFMVCQLDSGILTINISGNTTGSRYPEPERVPGKEAMEAFAEVIDFSMSHPAFDVAAIQSKLGIADASYEAEHTYVPATYGNYADLIIKGGYGWMPGIQYAFYDLDEDGEDDLLLGQNSWCDTWITMKDGNVESHHPASFRPCQDGSMEHYEYKDFSQWCLYSYCPLLEYLQGTEIPSQYVRIEYQNGQWTKYDRPGEDIIEEFLQVITQEEADAIRAQHPAVDLNWQDIQDFPMDENGTTVGSYLQSLDVKPSSGELSEAYREYLQDRAANDSLWYTHYRLLDINGDGIEDLLCSGNGETYWGIYPYRYGRMVHSFSMDFYLCEGSIIEHVPIYRDWKAEGGFDEIEEHIFYRFHEDLTQEVVAYAAYNKATASWQSDQDGTPMSTEEAEAILAKYPRIDQGMRPISELIG